MGILLTNQADSYAQLLTVLLVFVVVLGATAYTTKWIAGYQKKQGLSGNLELLDAVRLGNNKYLQIVRVGKTYVAVAVCKDTVTVLAQIPEEQLALREDSGETMNFREIFSQMRQKAGNGKNPSERINEPKDKEEE